MFVAVQEAAILHADADAFFASVEQRDDPRLRGRPVVVGGGVVTAASYEARAHGVHGGMGGARVRRLCPEAIFCKPRWSAYVEASRALFELFEATAPAVEGLSLEEAFLDVRGLGRIAGDMAWFLADDYIAPSKARAIRKEQIAMLEEIAPHALALTDAFGIPSNCLGPLGDPSYLRDSGLAL